MATTRNERNHQASWVSGLTGRRGASPPPRRTRGAQEQNTKFTFFFLQNVVLFFNSELLG